MLYREMKRRHDDEATRRDGEQRDAGRYGLVFLEPADLVDDRVVPVEEVDPERDEWEPQYAERLPLLVPLSVEGHELRHRVLPPASARRSLVAGLSPIG